MKRFAIQNLENPGGGGNIYIEHLENLENSENQENQKKTKKLKKNEITNGRCYGKSLKPLLNFFP